MFKVQLSSEIPQNDTLQKHWHFLKYYDILMNV